MILEKQIDERIAGLTAEIQTLVASHNSILATVAKNQTRFAQLTGAIEELKKLKGTKHEPSNNDITGDNARHSKHPDRIPTPHFGISGTGGIAVGGRELDKPDSTAD